MNFTRSGTHWKKRHDKWSVCYFSFSFHIYSVLYLCANLLIFPANEWNRTVHSDIFPNPIIGGFPSQMIHCYAFHYIFMHNQQHSQKQPVNLLSAAVIVVGYFFFSNSKKAKKFSSE